jgi:Lon-like protease
VALSVRLSRRALVLSVCAALVAALLAVAAFAPLPFTIVVPGVTANTLGSYRGDQVIVIKGAGTRRSSGKLLLTTIAATEPNATVTLHDVWNAWWDRKQAAMPRSAVYPAGNTTKEIERHNRREMEQSQDAATTAALHHLGLSPSRVRVTLNLADVGGPSAGLMFTLGIIDKLDGNGHGGDLTGGRTIAGTGTISARGEVGAVGGVPLKEQAARRDGATVFVVPRDECADAKAELPGGMRLVPVRTLDEALSALGALDGRGGRVPSC